MRCTCAAWVTESDRNHVAASLSGDGCTARGGGGGQALRGRPHSGHMDTKEAKTQLLFSMTGS